ncbi:MAG: CopG family transcriptional regulator [bacterium]|nr:CopG family transcriptional regulator [bacterium]MDZ4247755.1 CopG family transcriptional regulator [Patescibacteria group bacterium]
MTKATLYLQPQIHKALKLKAAQTDRSISDVANSAIESALAEDQEDIQTLTGRAGGSTEPYAAFLDALKSDGKL